MLYSDRRTDRDLVFVEAASRSADADLPRTRMSPIVTGRASNAVSRGLGTSPNRTLSNDSCRLKYPRRGKSRAVETRAPVGIPQNRRPCAAGGAAANPHLGSTATRGIAAQELRPLPDDSAANLHGPAGGDRRHR